MAVGDKDHRGVAVAVAVALGGFDQPLDLGLGQVLARPQVAVAAAAWGDCSFYGGWRDQLEVRLSHVFALPHPETVRIIHLLRTRKLRAVAELFRLMVTAVGWLIMSAIPPKADIDPGTHRMSVKGQEYLMHRSKQQLYSITSSARASKVWV